MPLNRAAFYAAARATPFGGRLTPQNVDGTNTILDEWEANWSGRDPRCLAYILATAFHETGGTMAPVPEGFAKTDAAARKIVSRRSYGKPDPETGLVYYGCGFVQLTWRRNYEAMGQILGLDLVHKPDLALDLKTAVRILFEGMFRSVSGKGDFSGKALDDYFAGPVGSVAEERQKAIKARAIVNGKDKAEQIATYYASFLTAIEKAAAAAPAPENVPAVVAAHDSIPVDTGSVSLVDSKVVQGGTVASLGGLAAILGPLLGVVSNPYALGALGLVILAGFVWLIWGRKRIAYQTGL
jgi:hypothetical protein